MPKRKPRTKEQALDDLSALMRDIFPYLHLDYRDALAMAMRALEREEQSTKGENMKLQIGDEVQVHRPGCDLHERIGRIVDVAKSPEDEGEFIVDLDGQPFSIHHTDLIKVVHFRSPRVRKKSV